MRRVVTNGSTRCSPRYVRHADVYVVDVPGAELVVDGVDPRALMILDAPPPTTTLLAASPAACTRASSSTSATSSAPRAAREAIEAELPSALEREITAVFLDREGPDAPTDKKHKLN